MNKGYCNKFGLLVLLLCLFILALGQEVCFAALAPGDDTVTVGPVGGGITDPPPPPPDPNPNTPPNQIDAAISSREVELATRQENTTLEEEQKLTAEKKSRGNISLKSGKYLVKPPTTLELIQSKQEIKP